ncbi:AAA family ATPase [Streptomyces sp. NPDC050560]|uniref:helix-turn-helix transcriptional regulator n=1 Tax=Streptomyces sp. NPDC050560 TaxID=3365630 RepID=UPI0037874C59
MLGDVEATRSVSPVFVGRAGELAALDDALVRATAGDPQALLVGGEAGVGKTRLVEEFAARARAAGAVVAVGGCVEMGAEGLPFAPFSTALRALRAQLPDEMAEAVAGQEELARLLPELGEAPRLHPGDEDSTARLFGLTARLLERLSGDRTLVVALEDLHWADASTRHLLGYLFRTLRTSRLVVVATYRTDDIHRRHPLRPLLAELDRLRTVRRVELSRFSRDEVGRQVAGILAREPEPSQVDDIFERSDGNAFFVEELAVATVRCDCSPGLTDTLRDLLLVRVERLPEPAQRAVRIAAEGGSTVEYPLLAAASGLAEDDLIEAMRAAVGASILIATADGDGFRFRHSLVREAVSDDLLPGERARVNRRFAVALEADPGLVPREARATRLASYWYHAHDADKALPAVLHASVEARRRNAYAEQLRLLERAMELWDAASEATRGELRPVDFVEVYPPCGCDPASTPLGFIDLLAEAAVAGRLCGERDRALKITKRALALLESDRDPLRSAWFYVQRSRLVQGLARGDGWQELGTAQDLVRGLPPSEVHAEVLSRAAAWGMLREPGHGSLAAAERAVEYARMVGAREIEMDARVTLATLKVDAGDVEAGLADMYEARTAMTELGGIASLGRCHVNLPSALEGVGRSHEAVAALKEGLAYCRGHGLVDLECWVLGNFSESLFSVGRWDEAAESASSALGVRTRGKPRCWASTMLAFLALERGESAEAARHLADARKHYGHHDVVPQHAIPLARGSLTLAATEGRLLDARAELETAVGCGFQPGTQRYAWPMLLAAAAAEADARAVPAAEPGRADTLRLIRDSAKTLVTGVPLWHAHEQWLRAELRRAEGADTEDDWLAAVAAFGPLERPYDLARVRHRLAERLLAAPGAGEDARERAAELLRQAGAVARHLGARPLGDAVRALGQRGRLALGRPAADTPADPVAALGLTSRERDVLRLVAAGRSNRQIAGELFISPKTASVHVSNILAKLGVSGRGEAAALAHQRGLFAEEAATHTG